MSKSDAKCSDFLKTVFLILSINFCTSAPVNVTENTYMQFIAELNRDNCSVPSQVQLPFDTTKVKNFEYLSSNLEICQLTELAKRNKEAIVLCKEIFDNMRSISCPTKTALPDINVELSENVCKDIGAKKDLIPEDDKSLLKRLTDGFLCDIMCDSEFEKACQVLLWSFEVRKLIASVANVQEPEQPNTQENKDTNGIASAKEPEQPNAQENEGVANVQEPEQPNAQENGEDTNENFMQDNAEDEGNPLQVSIASESGKRNDKEAKDVNEVIGPNGIIKVSDLHNDNPEEKLGVRVIPDKNGKQEKLVLKDKEIILGNQTFPKADISDAESKSTNNFKTSNTLSHQKSAAQTSNSDAKTQPMSKTTKGGSDVQNVDKQVQSNSVTQHEEVNGLPQGPATNFAVDEQSQDTNANAVHDEKGTNIKGHSQDTSNVLANENVPNIEILDETAQKDQNSKFLNKNGLPHESGNEKEPDAAAGLHNDGQTAPSTVNTLAQNKLQSTSSGADKFAKGSGVPFTDSQTAKVASQQKLVHVALQNKTSIARNVSKTDQTQINSDLKKVEVQDHIDANKIAPGLITDNGNKNTIKDQQKAKVTQQTEEIENADLSSAGTAMSVDEKNLANSQKSKATAINPDSKSITPNTPTETLTKTTVAVENIEGGSDLHQPADEEADHFEDLENTEDEEYSRPEYDGLYEVSKNKESNPNVPSPITIDKEIITSQNEKPIEFPSRNSFGQDPSDIQMIAAFPEQEDSHFFFYFLSIVLILMAGYLIFHNKQKIIALIVEGRHERNRRSHRIGYKKLETK